MSRRGLTLVAIAVVSLVTARLASPGAAAASGPDYAIPGGFGLPWTSGEGYRVTWEPADHWSNGKATGVAFDFSMDIGIPLYAPTSGWIYYLQDERPYSTNFGHYVEIVSEDGDWLIRMAHLRDPQHGEGPIEAGALVGHSGMSGVSAAHLHLELLVRDGEAWVRPDLNRLDHIYGHAISSLEEGAIVANHESVSRLQLADTLLPSVSGDTTEPVSLTVALVNTGAADLYLDAVQIALSHSHGDVARAETAGVWEIRPQEALTLTVPVDLDRGGTWQIRGLTYHGQETAGRLDAEGQITITSPRVAVTQMQVLSDTLDTQHPLEFAVSLANRGTEPVVYDAIELLGERPDGVPWHVSCDEVVELGPGETVAFTVESPWLAGSAGDWMIRDIACVVDGRRTFLDSGKLGFVVSGPELCVESLQVYDGDRALHMMMTLCNVGTAPIHPDQVEVWGWQPDDLGSFGASQTVRMPISPGASARLMFTVPTDSIAGLWRVAGAGAWYEGDYRPMSLPSEPVIQVAPLALLSLLK